MSLQMAKFHSFSWLGKSPVCLSKRMWVYLGRGWGQWKEPPNSHLLSQAQTTASMRGWADNSQRRYDRKAIVIKTLPSNAGGAGSILGQGAKISHSSWPKKQNVKQSILLQIHLRFFKWSAIKKKTKKKEGLWEFLRLPHFPLSCDIMNIQTS